MACGKPVVAYARGGVLETVVKDLTGIFFEEQNEEALLQAIQQCAATQWDSAAIRKNSERFSENNFINGLSTWIKSALEKKS
jgi:glycosyltransferase involved in cell wall biosynthesis